MSETEKDIEGVGIKVDYWKETSYLNEIGQPTGILFSFLSPDNKQCHQWVRCRDFLNDALRCHVSKVNNQIFGFRYKPDINPPLNMEKMRMLVMRLAKSTEKNPEEETKNTMASALAILNCMEKTANIEPQSVIQEVDIKKHIYLFEGSSEWMESSFMISLYTFLIRLGAKKMQFNDKGDLDANLEKYSKITPSMAGYDHDVGYLKVVWPYIYKILEKRKDLRYVKEDGSHFLKEKIIDLFHNYSGIVALCQSRKGQNMTGLEELVLLTKQIRGED